MYIVIAGGGMVGSGLAQQLVDARHDVVVIDTKKEICEWIASTIGALALHGSATDIDILEQAGIAKADVTVGTMRYDADNLAFALLSKSFDVPRVISRMRNPRYEAAYRKAGVGTTMRVVDVFVNQLLLEIEEPHLRQVATFGGGKASIVVDTIPEDARVGGMTVGQIAADADFPAQCVITGIYRAQEQTFVIPRGSARVHAGDRVFLVAEQKDLRKASKFLHRKGKPPETPTPTEPTENKSGDGTLK
ncbi:MAG TPA: TrkA family potassium uptake protein [Planctomycetota bacterium]|nr:TrkA family potassium uptake protein [Planctomycetota bacterium]